MKILRCLIVDDEPLAHRVIERFAENLSFIQIVRKCKNALEALDALHAEPGIDLMFLDIEMPKLSGLSLMRSLKHPPLVIFTTAYANHALESYELEAVDYLKKPFAFERFSQAIEKARRRLNVAGEIDTGLEATRKKDSPNSGAVTTPKDTPMLAVTDSVFVKSSSTMVRLELSQVSVIEGMGDYVKVWSNGEAVVSHQTLAQWESRLPGNAFVRLHRSFIVAVAKIDELGGTKVLVGNREVPVGRAYREDLMERMEKF